jgi:hypothetical protein
MNNWLKIGLPILVAVLLVIAAVGVTLAVTGGNSNQVGTAYRTVDTGNVQYVSGPYGPGYGCPAWRSAVYSGPGGWCWGRYN